MQNRTEARYAPPPTARSMGRHTESRDERPIKFRVQADRRQVDVLPAGAINRRAKRTAALSTNKSAKVIADRRDLASSDSGND